MTRGSRLISATLVAKRIRTIAPGISGVEKRICRSDCEGTRPAGLTVAGRKRSAPGMTIASSASGIGSTALLSISAV